MRTDALFRAILHIPFVPFSILFTRAVQLLDFADLAVLDRFAVSLQPEETSSESNTHPHRLYKLLCQAARLYIDAKAALLSEELVTAQNFPDTSGQFDLEHFEMDDGAAANVASVPGGPQTYRLSDWFYGNQQIMSFLDEEVVF